jgi:2,4-dienoyl-CoA reductase-like NADH-dependent reductase (Old Yellow Enzyme family)
MCQYSSVDGAPTDWHFAHLGRLAMGGAGIVFTEETAVEARGRKTYGCAGIWADDHVSKYRRIADFIRSQKCVPAMQLGHSGRKGSCHGATRDWAPLTAEDAAIGMPPWTPLAPSAIAASSRASLPKQMDHSDIQTVLQAWLEATARVMDAGFDILEIHGAHGYLIHQFLSPITNKRNDDYGGDRAGRMRFPLEVAETVRNVWPKGKPLFFRLSVVDGKGGLWGIDDTVEFAKELKSRGVDLVDCSSGGITGTSSMPVVKRNPGYQVDFSEKIRHGAEIMTMAVGLITTARQAETILSTGQADLIALARELLWNPNWPVHAAKELGVETAYDLLPKEYAHRLHRRDEVDKLPINRANREPTEGEVRLIETT